ncbi:filamentous hemagglutinin [Burkholderia sp. b14]|nr:filamentous hemagglutinin [Burkholderia sp. b14]
MPVYRDRFNLQLHPQKRKWISDREAVYAKRYGLSAEQASEELAIQASLQVQNGSPGERNQRAHKFLKQAHGMLPAGGESRPKYIFYATPEDVSVILCVRRVETHSPMLKRSG